MQKCLEKSTGFEIWMSLVDGALEPWYRTINEDQARIYLIGAHMFTDLSPLELDVIVR